MVGTKQEIHLNLEPLASSSETALSHIYLFLLCLVYSNARDVITSPQNTDEPSTYITTTETSKFVNIKVPLQWKNR